LSVERVEYLPVLVQKWLQRFASVRCIGHAALIPTKLEYCSSILATAGIPILVAIFATPCWLTELGAAIDPFRPVVTGSFPVSDPDSLERLLGGIDISHRNKQRPGFLCEVTATFQTRAAEASIARFWKRKSERLEYRHNLCRQRIDCGTCAL